MGKGGDGLERWFMKTSAGDEERRAEKDGGVYMVAMLLWGEIKEAIGDDSVRMEGRNGGLPGP